MIYKKEHLLNNLLFLFNKHLICSPFLHLNMFFYLFLQNISSLPKRLTILGCFFLLQVFQYQSVCFIYHCGVE